MFNMLSRQLHPGDERGWATVWCECADKRYCRKAKRTGGQGRVERRRRETQGTRVGVDNPGAGDEERSDSQRDVDEGIGVGNVVSDSRKQWGSPFGRAGQNCSQ